MSCGNDIQSGDNGGLSDGEAEIVDLMNRVELMKKERSTLWLREFKEWMDIASGKFVESSKGRSTSHPQNENHIRNQPSQGQQVEVSKYASDSVLASGDESSLNIVESDSSFVDISAGFRSQKHFDYKVLLGNAVEASLTDSGRLDQNRLKSNFLKGIDSALSHSRSSHCDDACTIPEAHRMAENGDLSPLTTIDDISGSHSSSVCPSSPPHFQEDLFQRRQNLVEEILQLSADSFSVVSSDSNTSCSEVEYSEYEQSVPGTKGIGEHISLNLPMEKLKGQSQGLAYVSENGNYLGDLSSDHTSKHCSNDFAAASDNADSAGFVIQDSDQLEKRKSRKKAKKRFISILEECYDRNACNQETEYKQEQIKQITHDVDFEIVGKRPISANCERQLDVDDLSELSMAYGHPQENIEFITTFFNTNIADSVAHEVSVHCMRCNCVLQTESTYKERYLSNLNVRCN